MSDKEVEVHPVEQMDKELLAMPAKTRLYRLLALSGNLLLMAWVVIWQLTLVPHPHINNVTLAIALAAPLLLPLPGILAGRPYTHSWATLVISFYLIHGIATLFMSNEHSLLAVVEIILAIAAFTGNILYAKTRKVDLYARKVGQD